MKNTVAPSVKQFVDCKFECSTPITSSRMVAGEAGTQHRVVEFIHSDDALDNNTEPVNPGEIGTLDDETVKAILAAFETA